MKIIWIMAFCLVCESRVLDRSADGNCLCGLAQRSKFGDSIERIVGGGETEVGEYPWFAILDFNFTDIHGKDQHSFCGGSLINSEYVLTAAHCVNLEAVRMLVTLGDHNSKLTIEANEIKSGPENLGIEIHPDHISNGFYNYYDFALIKLSQKIIWTDHPNIRPICLPDDKKELYVGRKAITAGVGLTKLKRPPVGDHGSNFLKETILEVSPREDCVIRNKDLICTVPAANNSACMGDSGGPLMTTRRPEDDGVTPGQNYELIGLPSIGNLGCSINEKSYDYFARVTFAIDWIKEKLTGSDEPCPRQFIK